MGNRANVIFVSGERISPAIYLHWNGGPESVYAFLAELERRGVRADADYEAARFVQVVGELFSGDGSESGHGLSLGIVSAPLPEISAEALRSVPTDPSDNGFYVVSRGGSGPFGLASVRRFVNGRELSAAEVSAELLAAPEDSSFGVIGRFFAGLQAQREPVTPEA